MASYQSTGQVPAKPVGSGTASVLSPPSGTDILLRKARALVENEKREGPFYGVWNAILYSQIFAFDPEKQSTIPIICPQFPLVLNIDTIPEKPHHDITPIQFPGPPARPETPIRQGPLGNASATGYHAQRQTQADIHSPEGQRLYVNPRLPAGASPVHIPEWFTQGYQRRRSTRIPDFVVFLCNDSWPSRRLAFILEAKKPVPAESNADRIWPIFLSIESQVVDQAFHAFHRGEQDCQSTIGVITSMGTLWRYFELTETDVPSHEETDSGWSDSSHEESFSSANTAMRKIPKALQQIFKHDEWLTLEDEGRSKEAFQAICRRIIELRNMI